MVPEILERRARLLSQVPPGPGPVLYWLGRDQRAAGNWALLYAQALALERKAPLAVVFTLTPGYLGAGPRMYDFMLRGLAALEVRLTAAGIPFFLLRGDPPAAFDAFAKQTNAGAGVVDFDPLRLKRRWRQKAAETLALFEVDAHNIVPAWVVSQKAEWGAYTLRPKIHRLLSDYLTDFPPLVRHPFPWKTAVKAVDWEAVRKECGAGAPGPLPSGEAAAVKALALFLRQRLEGYDEKRNDPNADGQSELSAYLHFGQLSAQRAAKEARRVGWESKDGQAFLEQLIVRRELSDNFCLYNPHYDLFEGFPAWAQKTLNEHRRDQRPFLYSREQFEAAATHDPLWNAAQREMVNTGKMHGYMRMYWAKKILEWSPSPEEALATAIFLNDRYELDGRDPNGYAGIAWAIGGTHDRPWFDRPIYGMIRYMSEGGARGKFDVKAYIQRQPPG